MIIEILLMIIGIGLLIKGADFLVTGSSALAEKFNVPKLVIGLTIVAFGTSLPELFINIFASINKQSNIVLGNILGSNIANITLILGLTVIFVGSIKIKQSTIWREIPYSILATLLLLILSLGFISNNGIITLVEGIILLIFFTAFLYYVFILIKNDKNKITRKEDKTVLVSNLKIGLMIISGLIALILGGRWTVNGAINIANYFHISEFIISATIVAVGTSLPELVTTIVATKKGSFDIAVGNLIGSNIFNILLILGISSVINPITVHSYIITDIICLLVITIIMFSFIIFTGKKHYLDRWEGVILFLIYIAYLILIIFRK